MVKPQVFKAENEAYPNEVAIRISFTPFVAFDIPKGRIEILTDEEPE
jgi:hypothetical protein